MCYVFSVLAGMFKALRDRDLWGAQFQGDGAELWYEGFGWYQAWSKTEAYLGPFPLDAWHNFDVLVLACAFVAGRGYVDWSVVAFLAIALPSKFLFYHIVLMKNPAQEFRAQMAEFALLNKWIVTFFKELFTRSTPK